MGISDVVDAFDGELLALFLLGTYLVAGVGTALSCDLRDMYERNELPPLAPWPWLFGPVWAFLYTASGVAAYLVRIEGGLWTSGSDGNLAALVLYCVLQVVLTTYTIPASRDLHVIAAIIVGVSLGLSIATLVLFSYFSWWPIVALSLLTAWIAFALYLQIGVAVLNRSVYKECTSDAEESMVRQDEDGDFVETKKTNSTLTYARTPSIGAETDDDSKDYSPMTRPARLFL
jgi:benzodiazapine receptor